MADSEITIKAFLTRYSKGAFEFIEGEFIPLLPETFGHVYLSNKLLMLLDFHTRQLGSAFVKLPFVIPSQASKSHIKGSRVPDVAFITAERLNAYKEANPDWRDNPLALIPDLVIEVISPTDKFSNVVKKILRYLKDGVRLGWVIDPQERIVMIYTPGSNQHTTLQASDTLTGGDVLPGFEIPVAKLFE